MKKTLFVFVFSIGFSTVLLSQYCPGINAQYGTGPSTTICQGNCAVLTASINDVQQTNTYNVYSIPYAPPYPINGAGTGVSVGTDDVWSPVISLPFPFCFFGTSYNSCIVRSNGVISFNTASAGGYCPWSYSSACPNAALPLNAIFGVYHDIDPSVCGSVTYTSVGNHPFYKSFIEYCEKNGYYRSAWELI